MKWRRHPALWGVIGVALASVWVSFRIVGPGAMPPASVFTVEPIRPSFVDRSRDPECHVWLTLPDGRRTRLSEHPVRGTAVLRTNGLVVWQENRVVGREAFEEIRANHVLAADATGRRSDLTEWLRTRASSVLPTAPVESLAALPGSEPSPSEYDGRDWRAGVHDFMPVGIELAHWRPGITIWCTVPCGASFRPLAMQVPAEDIAARLRVAR